MSVTYDELISSIVAAFEQAGISVNGVASAPQRHSVKAGAGAGEKMVATITALRIAHGARGGERAGSVTSGSLSFSLSPSKASAPVALASMGEVMNKGHLAIINLDGVGGVRVLTHEVTGAPGVADFLVTLTLSHIVPSLPASSPFAGDV